MLARLGVLLGVAGELTGGDVLGNKGDVPVHQVEVEVLDAELVERVLNGLTNVVVVELEELGGDPDLLTGDTPESLMPSPTSSSSGSPRRSLWVDLMWIGIKSRCDWFKERWQGQYENRKEMRMRERRRQPTNVTVAGLEGVANSITNLTLGRLPGAETDRGDGSARVELEVRSRPIWREVVWKEEERARREQRVWEEEVDERQRGAKRSAGGSWLAQFDEERGICKPFSKV